MTCLPAGETFADYFVVCGLDSSQGLQPEKRASPADGDDNSIDPSSIPPLKRCYKTKVLAHYPSNVEGNPFDEDAISMLCMPQGVTFHADNRKNRPIFHTFLVTREDGSKLYGAALQWYEQVHDQQVLAQIQALNQACYGGRSASHHNGTSEASRPSKNGPASLYQSKCVGLVLTLPFFDTCKKFLYQFHSFIFSMEGCSLPLESYIFNIIYEVPKMPQGRSMKLNCCGTPTICQRPASNQMPLFDRSLKDFFVLLGIDSVLQLFTCALLEHQIILFSRDMERLMLVAESISHLLYPFSWQHVYVPLLPTAMLHFLDAPVPFIMGLHSRGDDDKSQLELPSEASLCFVDIDNQLVEIPEDLPEFPWKATFVRELEQSLRASMGRFNIPLGAESLHQGGQAGDSMNGGQDGSGKPVSLMVQDLLQSNEMVSRVAAIAERTGVSLNLERLGQVKKMDMDLEEGDPENLISQKELEKMQINACIREIFCNYFVKIFRNYESFIILQTDDMETWINSRELMQNFDKSTFLSDQPEASLPFLSSFLETQMFTSWIDNKILQRWENTDYYWKVFDDKIKLYQQQIESGSLQSPSTENMSQILTLASSPERDTGPPRIDLVATLPHWLEGMTEQDLQRQKQQHLPGSLPPLNSNILSQSSSVSPRHKAAQWKRSDRKHQHALHVTLSDKQRQKFVEEARSKFSLSRQPSLSVSSSTVVEQTNWKFVEGLLKECKIKTKRMLISKMGQEAIELGHSEANISGVEENTMIASLCDLLERIWSHGLQNKKGKSALWSHLVSYQRVISKPHRLDRLSPGRSSAAFIDSDQTHGIQPLSTHLVSDIKKIQKMNDVISDVGKARAWIRLALERKLLSKHLKELVSNRDLCRANYKRYAFLRSEEEREQFLCHLLSLNAVDYYCFTNSFSSCIVSYRILIVLSRKFSAATTANPWICLAGEFGDTGIINIPKNSDEITFEHRNLGRLTTLRIGHDNSGFSPKWMTEVVFVQNRITGHIYKFPCGRWVGRGVDDGSLERLLVGEMMLLSTNLEELSQYCHTPPAQQSPVTVRRSSIQLGVSHVQEILTDAINNITKHFYKPEKERGNLTVLLCGEKGLVFALELVFQYGFKSTRLFRNNFFMWDFLEKVARYFDSVIRDDEARNMSAVKLRGQKSFCHVFTKVNSSSQALGKDGKFQILVCLGVREHLLHVWLPLIADTPVTVNMYDEESFFRSEQRIQFVTQILGALTEFNFMLEASLIRNIEI